MTIRAEILTAIQAQLSTLTIANGYQSDVGLNVRYWQDLPVEYDGPPIVTFFDEQGKTDEIGTGLEHRLEMRIDAIAYVNDALLEGCNLLADIVALISKNRKWTPAVINSYLTSNTKEIELKGKQAVRVSQEFEVVYRAPRHQI